MAGKKSYKGWKILIFSFTVAIMVMTVLVIYDWWLEKKSQFTSYPEFGIDLPTDFSIHGIDVSKYQNIIDWQSVRQMKVNDVQIDFTFIKATEGLDNEDAFFARNWKKSKDAGLTRGAYHYFLATKSGKAQAENFINSVKLQEGDLPPVLDIEQTYGVPVDKMKKRATEWLETIRNYYGISPIIYTNADFYQQYLKDDFDKYPLWVAHYLRQNRPRIYRDWDFWQHSETGRVNGIFTQVDFNVFNGDSTAFKKLLISN